MFLVPIAPPGMRALPPKAMKISNNKKSYVSELLLLVLVLVCCGIVARMNSVPQTEKTFAAWSALLP